MHAFLFSEGLRDKVEDLARRRQVRHRVEEKGIQAVRGLLGIAIAA